jgi:hypothetical protein
MSAGVRLVPVIGLMPVVQRHVRHVPGLLHLESLLTCGGSGMRGRMAPWSPATGHVQHQQSLTRGQRAADALGTEWVVGPSSDASLW